MAGNGDKGSIWTSRKAQIVVVGIVAVLAITLGGSALGMTDAQRTQAINALEWLVAIMLGGHTISDVAHMVTNRNGSSTATEPKPTDDGGEK